MVPFKLTFNLPSLASLVKAGDIPCKGTGITLGLTNGTSNAGLYGYTQDSAKVITAVPNKYGSIVGQGTPDTGIVYSLGITKDSTKSGIVADTTSLTLICNGIIKY